MNSNIFTCAVAQMAPSSDLTCAVMFKVVVSMSSRGGKKVVTHVLGLEYFPSLKMKEASKALGKRFACSTAVKDTPTGVPPTLLYESVSSHHIQEKRKSRFRGMSSMRSWTYSSFSSRSHLIRSP